MLSGFMVNVELKTFVRKDPREKISRPRKTRPKSASKIIDICVIRQRIKYIEKGKFNSSDVKESFSNYPREQFQSLGVHMAQTLSHRFYIMEILIELSRKLRRKTFHFNKKHLEFF